MSDAHPAGARPFARENYVAKFETLAEYAIDGAERERFVDAAARVADLRPDELAGLTPAADKLNLGTDPDGLGIFDA